MYIISLESVCFGEDFLRLLWSLSAGHVGIALGTLVVSLLSLILCLETDGLEFNNECMRLHGIDTWCFLVRHHFLCASMLFVDETLPPLLSGDAAQGAYSKVENDGFYKYICDDEHTLYLGPSIHPETCMPRTLCRNPSNCIIYARYQNVPSNSIA